MCVFQSNKLKLCPFCGGDSASFVHDDQGFHFVSCDYCGARGPWENTRVEAEQQWNKRGAIIE